MRVARRFSPLMIPTLMLGFVIGIAGAWLLRSNPFVAPWLFAWLILLALGLVFSAAFVTQQYNRDYTASVDMKLPIGVIALHRYAVAMDAVASVLLSQVLFGGQSSQALQSVAHPIIASLIVGFVSLLLFYALRRRHGERLYAAFQGGRGILLEAAIIAALLFIFSAANSIGVSK